MSKGFWPLFRGGAGIVSCMLYAARVGVRRC